MKFAAVLILALTLAACSAKQSYELPQSACAAQSFEGSSFTVCQVPGGKVEVHGGVRSFAELQRNLGSRADQVAFAMNAGMFDQAGQPIGLMIAAGKQVHAINLRKGGGNFHLLPNGVFAVRSDGRAQVVESNAFLPRDVQFATQSGPMLVIGGKLHPKFDSDGSSRYIRNGVGVAPDGVARFVISDDPVSFGKFARFFRDVLKAPDALYFDGSVSSLWDPVNARMDSFTELGPMVVVFKAGESAPGRAGPAKP